MAETKHGYKIWAVDDVVYGPVDHAVVVGWIVDQRVLPDTWVFVEKDKVWKAAGEAPEFKKHFAEAEGRPPAPAAEANPLIAGIKPGALRKISILNELSDQQLGRFAQFMEVQYVGQHDVLLRQGEPGDAMYLVLEGLVRVRTIIGDKENTLVYLKAGDFFGEISIFDHGPRSADVVANQYTVLLKISAQSFQKLTEEFPELATPFLVAMCKTLVHRIREDNHRHYDFIHFKRAAEMERGRS
ncbi:MAG: cyclic nucleotide-binding domain-containing protein [Pedosphaera sp.]|nr:cyclic nucleotide-binding domain-containing protein [Pedosphaera sp.]MST00647.1 cyclic nucleotide-binding domain-containing protein [Pedosphaera sp.]